MYILKILKHGFPAIDLLQTKGDSFGKDVFTGIALYHHSNW